MSISDIPAHSYPARVSAYPSSAGAFVLDSTDEFVVMVFRLPKSGTLNKIGWRSAAITPGTSFVLKISLETVAETIGQPVATTNATKTLYASNAESADITNLNSNTVYFTSINGSTGIAVTAGDLVAVTFRLTAVNGASITVVNAQFHNDYTLAMNQYGGDFYFATYLGGSWALIEQTPMISLEYSDGFCPHFLLQPPCTQDANAWGSNDSPDLRGMKFKYPIKCRLSGCSVVLEADSDVDIILYEPDEYTVASGFPITISATKRRSSGRAIHSIIFPVKPEIEANTFYRIVFLPKNTTDINILRSTLSDDGSYSGASQTLENDNISYTYRNGFPSSGDHTWTDSSNDRIYMSVLIDGIDAGAAGGISRSRQLMG
jgi:hypothetical protein